MFVQWGESSGQSFPADQESKSHLPLGLCPAEKGQHVLVCETVINLPHHVAFGLLFFGVSLCGSIRAFKDKCSEKLKCKLDAVNKSVVATPKGSILKLFFVMTVAFFLKHVVLKRANRW